MIYDNGRPFSSLDSFNVEICRPTAFVGGTTNARGDKDGTDAAHTLFTITGDVIVKFYGVCMNLLAGATATLEVGVTGNTAGLIPQTLATDIDANEIWINSVPILGVEAIGNIPENIIVNGLDIIETAATADITSGNIYYICLWRPLTTGQDAAGVSIVGNVVKAGTQI